MNLAQAREISRLSTAPSDGCTFAPDLGFSQFCTMHDHLLQHFVYKTHPLNGDQIKYLAARDMLDTTLTRKQADHLFREALNEKIDHSADPGRKVWYWFWRNVYYFGVATWRRIKK